VSALVHVEFVFCECIEPQYGHACNLPFLKDVQKPAFVQELAFVQVEIFVLVQLLFKIRMLAKQHCCELNFQGIVALHFECVSIGVCIVDLLSGKDGNLHIPVFHHGRNIDVVALLGEVDDLLRRMVKAFCCNLLGGCRLDIGIFDADFQLQLGEDLLAELFKLGGVDEDFLVMLFEKVNHPQGIGIRDKVQRIPEQQEIIKFQFDPIKWN
jgi:hypothetical protein